MFYTNGGWNTSARHRLISVLAERDRSDGALRAEKSRGHLKGFVFEELIAPLIDAAHAPHQGIVEATGRSRGVLDKLTGDFVAQPAPHLFSAA